MLQRILRPSLLVRSPLAAFQRTVFPSPVVRTFKSAPICNIEAVGTTIPRTAAPPPPPAPAPQASTNAEESTDHLRLLPLLRAQPKHYITIHIQGFPFLVTVGDTLTLPFRLKGVTPGDLLRLTHASILGSRDYTLKGNPFIDEKLYTCRAVVVSETAEPMRVKEKTKRRNRKIKKVKSKHTYTSIRIRELTIGGEEE
ncbi:ribosomal protein L21-like protein [Geopyxis carbonaria]|nr:ribosomal protein L21-like protein [Geopyxis carbonaria]